MARLPRHLVKISTAVILFKVCLKKIKISLSRTSFPFGVFPEPFWSKIRVSKNFMSGWFNFLCLKIWLLEIFWVYKVEKISSVSKFQWKILIFKCTCILGLGIKPYAVIWTWNRVGVWKFTWYQSTVKGLEITLRKEISDLEK